MSSNNEDSSLILGQTNSTSPLSDHNGRGKRKSQQIAAAPKEPEATSRDRDGQLKDDGSDPNGSEDDDSDDYSNDDSDSDDDDDVAAPKKKKKKTGK